MDKEAVKIAQAEKILDQATYEELLEEANSDQE